MPSTTLRLTDVDLRDAARLHSRLGKGHRYWLDLLVTVPFVWFVALVPFFLSEVLVLLSAMVGAVLGLLVYLLWRAWRLVFPSRRRTVAERREIVWSADGIALTSRLGTRVYRWPRFHQWAADERVVLLYVDRRAFQILPRRVFASFVEGLQVENYLTAAGVRRVGPKR